MSRPRTKHTDTRREQIISAARTLFIRQGYAKTSVDDISSAIGMTKSSLYYYFKNKEELFYQTFEQEWKGNLTLFIKAARRKKEPDEQIIAYIKASLRYYEEIVVEHNIPIKRLIEHRYMFKDFLAEVNAERINFFASCIADGIDSGLFEPQTNPHQIADLIWKTKYSMQFDMLGNFTMHKPAKADFRHMEADIVLAIGLILKGIKA